MAAPGQKKRLALDTNLLFDLAAGKDFAHTFREIYQERGYALAMNLEKRLPCSHNRATFKP